MVTMAPKLTFGTSMADWQDRINVERMLRERTEKARVSVEFDGAAQQALPAKGIKTADGWSIMLEATKCKTVDEINCLKMAFAAGDAGWFRAWELLKPGAIDVEVSQQAMQAAFKAGADAVPPGHFRSGS